MNAATVFVGMDTYMDSDPDDGLYESDIQCSECAEPIGAWMIDGIVETFEPYWMCDEDNNDNVCEQCYTDRMNGSQA